MQQLAMKWLAVAAGVLCAWVLLLSAPALAFDNSNVSGSYAFQLNKFGTCPNQSVIVGLFTFDGAGNASGKFTNYSSNKGGTGPKVSTGTATGTYTVNSDGTGTINFTSPDTVTLAFTIDSAATSAQRLELILLSLHSWSCAESGYAIQQ
jgi:hypothetical protein